MIFEGLEFFLTEVLLVMTPAPVFASFSNEEVDAAAFEALQSLFFEALENLQI